MKIPLSQTDNNLNRYVILTVLICLPCTVSQSPTHLAMVSYDQAVILQGREAILGRQEAIEVLWNRCDERSSSAAECWPLPCKGQSVQFLPQNGWRAGPAQRILRRGWYASPLQLHCLQPTLQQLHAVHHKGLAYGLKCNQDDTASVKHSSEPGSLRSIVELIARPVQDDNSGTPTQHAMQAVPAATVASEATGPPALLGDTLLNISTPSFANNYIECPVPLAYHLACSHLFNVDSVLSSPAWVSQFQKGSPAVRKNFWLSGACSG